MLEEKILPTTVERVAILLKHREKFSKIYTFMEEMQARLQNGEELAGYIIECLNLKKRYTTNADNEAMRDIIEALRPSTDMPTFLKDFLKDAALSSSQMDVLIQKLNRIPIITVHQSKGCEFDTVIIAGADDNNFPSYGAKQSGTEEEEKRVFYVAITRAKEKLVLTRAIRNGKYTMRETPYFWMIPDEYVQTNLAWRIGE
jgi:DNA helicase-2/ATP-dependent DNA helicase PcrA